MKPCWKHAGLTNAGAQRVDAIIGQLTDIWIKVEDRALILSAINEALFRAFELPNRTLEFQARYKSENGPI